MQRLFDSQFRKGQTAVEYLLLLAIMGLILLAAMSGGHIGTAREGAETFFEQAAPQILGDPVQNIN